MISWPPIPDPDRPEADRPDPDRPALDHQRGDQAAPLDWVDDAACKGRTELFFAPRAERPQARVRREAQARLLCRRCVVAEVCRQFAREHHEYGFWGGESEETRHLAGYTVAAPIGVRGRHLHPVETVA